MRSICGGGESLDSYFHAVDNRAPKQHGRSPSWLGPELSPPLSPRRFDSSPARIPPLYPGESSVTFTRYGQIHS